MCRMPGKCIGRAGNWEVLGSQAAPNGSRTVNRGDEWEPATLVGWGGIGLGQLTQAGL
jgi:hypothetical protein